jgi:hypothetical protein
VAHWKNRQFDRHTADAIALMTLWIGASDADDARATQLLGELLADGRGHLEIIEGLQTLCAALLMVLEIDTGVVALDVIQRIGAMVAAAGNGIPIAG